MAWPVSVARMALGWGASGLRGIRLRRRIPQDPAVAERLTQPESWSFVAVAAARSRRSERIIMSKSLDYSENSSEVA